MTGTAHLEARTTRVPVGRACPEPGGHVWGHPDRPGRNVMPVPTSGSATKRLPALAARTSATSLRQRPYLFDLSRPRLRLPAPV